MKKTYLISLLILGLSCNSVDNIFEENFERGGYIEFVDELEINTINLLTFDEFTFSEGVIDPNNNATLYQLDLIYDDIVVENFITIDAFPATLQFTGAEVLSALNLTIEQISLSEPLVFIAKVTTPNGVFKGTRSDFDFSTNTQNGGNNGANVFRTSREQAIQFGFTFVLPPPTKLRGTSFEEPFGNDLPYTKPGGANEDEELVNNPGERAVQYTAQGTGVDDEIGFRSFMDFNNGSNPGFTSEKIGVSSEDGIIEAGFPDGSQAYETQDSDGILSIVFDRVEVDHTVYPRTGVQVQYYASVAGYEQSDIIIIKAEIERANGTTETIELLNIDGDDIDNGLEGRWITANSGLLLDVVAYTLTIESLTTADDERLFFDQMMVYTIE
ncbi:hypothetical protein [Hyunsoonleella ulvae]|uniref:hypothetical protein n=1 Tax=Hyunsoonleella ulvae TaxID=2799948 RepID=UPI00193986BE|nr:hypothetical protein [Hyunsoonleella ulvae]